MGPNAWDKQCCPVGSVSCTGYASDYKNAPIMCDADLDLDCRNVTAQFLKVAKETTVGGIAKMLDFTNGALLAKIVESGNPASPGQTRNAAQVVEAAKDMFKNNIGEEKIVNCAA